MANAADTAPAFPWQPEGCYRTPEPPRHYNPVESDGRLLSLSLDDAAADVTTGTEATGRREADFSTFLPTQHTDTSLPPPQVISAEIETLTNKSALRTP